MNIVITEEQKTKKVTIQGVYFKTEQLDESFTVEFKIEGGGEIYNIELVDGDSANPNTTVSNVGGTSFDVNLKDLKSNFATGTMIISGSVVLSIEDVVNVSYEDHDVEFSFEVDNQGSLLELLPLEAAPENLNVATGYDRDNSIEVIGRAGDLNVQVSGGSGDFDIIWNNDDFAHPAITVANPEDLNTTTVRVVLSSKPSDIPEEYLKLSGGDWIQRGQIQFTIRDKITLEDVTGIVYWSFKISVIAEKDERAEYRYESRTVSGRFRIRDKDGINWYDMCYDELYAYNIRDRQWQRLIPGKTFVRDANNIDWLEINCDFDPEFDDPCQALGDDKCNGSPSDPFAGSGNGKGSNGPEFNSVDGYPQGYDLPDCFLGGFAVSTIPVAQGSITQATGFMIQRPGLLAQETYDPVGNSPDDGHTGYWNNPNVVGTSTWSRGSAITETIYKLTQEDGFYEILYAAYDAISIDAYYMGKRVATTCGQVPKNTRGVLTFSIKLALNEGHDKVLIRVRGSNRCSWALQLAGPKGANEFPDFDPHNSSDYAAIEENLYNEPEFIRPEYLGTPVFPAPCRATVGNTNIDRSYPWYLSNRVSTRSFFEYYHYAGDVAGNMVLDYSSWTNSDKIEIYHAGIRIATNYDFRQENGSIKFEYHPEKSEIKELVIRVFTESLDDAEELSTWYYTLYCVDIDPNGDAWSNPVGPRRFPWDCEAGDTGTPTVNPTARNKIFSMGHPCMEDHVNIDNGVAEGVFRIQFNSGTSSEIDNVVTVFNQDGSVIQCFNPVTNMFEDSRSVLGQGVDLDYFNFDQVTGEVYTEIYVRVESMIGDSWSYIVGCPVPLIDITLDPIPIDADFYIEDATAVAGTGASQTLVKLTRPMQVEVSIDFSMSEGSAKDQIDYCNEVGTLVFPVGVTEMALPFSLAPCDDVIPPEPPAPPPSQAGGWKTAMIEKIHRPDTVWDWDGNSYESVRVYVGQMNINDDISFFTSSEPTFIGLRTPYIAETYVNNRPAKFPNVLTYRTVTLDESTGSIGSHVDPNFGDVFWEIPDQANLEAWRVSVISSDTTVFGSEFLDTWYTNTEHRFGIHNKVPSSTSRELVVVLKIEYKYRDGSITSHNVTLQSNLN